LVDHTLDEVRVKADAMSRSEPFSLALFIDDAASAAALKASERGCAFAVPAVDHDLGIAGNRERLLAALANLLGNAFKFTQPHTEVMLLAYAAGDQVYIDVEDHCGGLTADNVEKMFKPFSQRHDDKTGLGLGLVIARQSVEADAGTLTVRNLAGTGCIFTIRLPRHDLH
jgi:signal transduction histidine kinase